MNILQKRTAQNWSSTSNITNLPSKISVQIYSQNVSGCKGKIVDFNDVLARNIYNIYCIQETWSIDTVLDSELIGMTAYNIFRHDRSSFRNSKKTGGGVVVLIKNSIEAHDIVLVEHTRIELQAIRLKLVTMYYCLVNVYLPPYTTRSSMVYELSTVLSQIRKKFPLEEIIMLGVFNFAKIKWQFNTEIPGTITFITENLGVLDEKFLKTCSFYCLMQ